MPVATSTHKKPPASSPSASASPSSPSTRSPCPYYLQGICTFGDRCLKPHVGTPKARKTYGNAKTTANANAKVVDNGNAKKGTVLRPVRKLLVMKNSGGSESSESERSAGSSSRSGRAGRGGGAGWPSTTPTEDAAEVDDAHADLERNTNGWHNAADANNNEGEASRWSSSDRGRSPTTTTTTTKSPCVFFQLDGACGNGDACEFAHGSPALAPLSSSSPAPPPPQARSAAAAANGSGAQAKNGKASVPTIAKPTPKKPAEQQTNCAYYGQPGGCRRGDGCKYQHVEPAGATSDAKSKSKAKAKSSLKKDVGAAGAGAVAAKAAVESGSDERSSFDDGCGKNEQSNPDFNSDSNLDSNATATANGHPSESPLTSAITTPSDLAEGGDQEQMRGVEDVVEEEGAGDWGEDAQEDDHNHNEEEEEQYDNNGYGNGDQYEHGEYNGGQYNNGNGYEEDDIYVSDEQPAQENNEEEYTRDDADGQEYEEENKDYDDVNNNSSSSSNNNQYEYADRQHQNEDDEQSNTQYQSNQTPRNGPTRRRSWYGAGWDDEPTITTTTSSPTITPMPTAASPTDQRNRMPSTPQLPQPMIRVPAASQVSVIVQPQPPRPPAPALPPAPTLPAPAPALAPAPPMVVSFQPHWSQYADPLISPDIPFCKLHAQALCAGGAACRFRHALTPAEYTSLFHDQQPMLFSLGGPQGVAAPATTAAVAPVPLGVAPVILITPTTTAAAVPIIQSPIMAASAPEQVAHPPQKQCSFYPLGKCYNGDRCPYAHTVHPTSLPERTDDSYTRGGGGGGGSGNFDGPCKFFSQWGTCKRGAGCKYLHTKDGELGSATNNNNNDSLCGRANETEEKDEEVEDDGWGMASRPAKPQDEEVADDSGGWGVAATNDDSWNSNAWGTAGTQMSEWDEKPADQAWGGGSQRQQQQQQSSSSSRRTGGKECYAFARDGRCNRSQCSFSHDVEPVRRSNSGLNRGTSYNSGGDEGPATDSSSRAANSQGGNRASEKCRFYARGDCRRGDKCKNRHEDDNGRLSSRSGWDSSALNGGHAAVEENENGNSGWDNDSGWPPQEPQEDTADAPDPWANLNSATFEDEETGDATAAAAEPVDQSGVLCQSFLKRGVCHNIEDCPFSHGEEVEAARKMASPAQQSTWPIDECRESETRGTEVVDDDTTSKSTSATHDVVEEEESGPEAEPMVFEHRTVKRFMMQSEVVFGNDITPETVTTPADSKKLELSNLPPDATPDEITTLTCPYGKIHEIISLDETVHSSVIQVEFEDPVAAYRAFKNLHGKTFRDMVISAKTNARVAPTTASVGQKIYVKASWPRPSRSAWAHYPKISKAKEQAQNLNNIILRGRAIKASFVPPKKAQINAFAVHLENIDPDLTKGDISDACPDNTHITIDKPIYEKDATGQIKFTIAELGESEVFDVVPVTTGNSVHAFITFKSEAAAAAVLDGLKSDLPYLGKQRVLLRNVQYARYCISRSQFDVIQMDIQALQEQSVAKKCTIEFNNHVNGKLIWIRIHAPFDNLTEFTSMNSELRRLLQGVIVMTNGKPTWDDYFEIPSGANALEQLQQKYNTFIQCDRRAKRLLVHGSETNQQKLQSLIARLLSKVHAQRHEIDLARPKLNALINGGFAVLQDTIGANKVLLDVVNSLLIIRGTPDDVESAKTTISTFDVASAKSPTGRNVCQICHHVAANPILLSCRHSYCTSCLQFMVQQMGSAPFHCISQHTLDGQTNVCSTYIPLVIIETILATETGKLLKDSFFSFIRSRPDEFFFCPSLDCEAVHRVRDKGVNIKCTLCAAELCTYCKSLAHIGLACSAI